MEDQQPVKARFVQLTISGRRRKLPLIEVSLYNLACFVFPPKIIVITGLNKQKNANGK